MAGLAGVLTSVFMGLLGYAPEADLGIRIIYVFGALILIPAVLIFTKYPIKK